MASTSERRQGKAACSSPVRVFDALSGPSFWCAADECCALRSVPLDPEYREPQDQEHQEDHDEDVEQEAGDISGCGRYAGEAEDAGDDRDHEEEQRPFQKCHSFYSSLRAAAPD